MLLYYFFSGDLPLTQGKVSMNKKYICRNELWRIAVPAYVEFMISHAEPTPYGFRIYADNQKYDQTKKSMR